MAFYIAPKKLEYHPFHIVNPSPWPLVTAFSAFFIVFGLVLYMHAFQLGLTLFTLGLTATVLNASFWWRDIVREGTYEGAHTHAVQDGLRFGMVLFIVSEVMLFFAFFWAFFHSSLNPVPELGCVWPPKGIHAINPWLIPLLNTVLLLTSGAALTWSHAALLGGYRLETITGLLVTITLAVFFTLFQAYEYVNAPFTISDGVYGSTFYMLTGLHGAHVIIGTIMLIVALYRAVRHHYTTQRHIGYEAAAWYWHFVDVVWIFLFLVVYTWGEGI
jgi:cytochrome c oxidase subunit 3